MGVVVDHHDPAGLTLRLEAAPRAGERGESGDHPVGLLPQAVDRGDVGGCRVEGVVAARDAECQAALRGRVDTLPTAPMERKELAKRNPPLGVF